jgi:hypothetical protein
MVSIGFLSEMNEAGHTHKYVASILLTEETVVTTISNPLLLLLLCCCSSLLPILFIPGGDLLVPMALHEKLV